jgi:hypothetical protein
MRRPCKHSTRAALSLKPCLATGMLIPVTNGGRTELLYQEEHSQYGD